MGVDGCINTLFSFEDWKMTMAMKMKDSGEIIGQISEATRPTDMSAVVMTPQKKQANTGALLDESVPNKNTDS